MSVTFPTFIAAATPVDDAGSTSRTITVPAGVTTSHFGIIMMGSASGSQGAASATGWSSRVSAFSATNETWNVLTRLGGHTAGDTITLTNAGANQISNICAIWIDTGGKDLDVVGTPTARSSSSSTCTAASITTTTYDPILIISTERTTATGTTVTGVSPATVTQLYYREATTTANVSHYVGVFDPGASGATAAQTVTYSGASTNGAAVQFALVPQSGSSLTASPADAVGVTDSAASSQDTVRTPADPVGVTDSVTVVQTSTGNATPADPVGVTDTLTINWDRVRTQADPIGATDSLLTLVQQWALNQPAWAGHRDGFYSTYGEFTVAGYNALKAWNPRVAWNIDVFMTTDGEWVASHDPTTVRVLSGANLTINSSTWASIQPKTTLVGGNPVARIDDIVAVAPPGTVFFVDNKGNNNYAALRSKLTALGLGPSNVVAKTYIGFNALLSDWHSAGYTTWAYGFDTDCTYGTNGSDGTGKFAAYHALADWLGFDYAGNQTNWNEIIGYGQPSFAHILTSTADKTTADSKAATAGGSNFGYMVANVSGVIPQTGIADPVGVTDTATENQDYVRPVADPVGVTDAAVTGQDYVRTAADPVGVTDGLLDAQDYVRAQTDPVGLTDALAVIWDRAVTITDPAGLTDTATASQNAAGTTTITDPVGATDTVAATFDRTATATDPVGILDQVAAVFARAVTIADPVGVADVAVPAGTGKVVPVVVTITASTLAKAQVAASISTQVTTSGGPLVTVTTS